MFFMYFVVHSVACCGVHMCSVAHFYILLMYTAVHRYYRRMRVDDPCRGRVIHGETPTVMCLSSIFTHPLLAIRAGVLSDE